MFRDNPAEWKDTIRTRQEKQKASEPKESDSKEPSSSPTPVHTASRQIAWLVLLFGLASFLGIRIFSTSPVVYLVGTVIGGGVAIWFLARKHARRRHRS